MMVGWARSRHAVAVITGVFAIALGTACGGDDDSSSAEPGTSSTAGEDTTTPAAPTTGDTYVVDLPSLGEEVLVAVVVSQAEAGKEREVKAYLCDGRTAFEWYPGATSGDQVQIESDDGDSTIDLRLATDHVTGTVELPDGRSADFDAPPATGISGLYNLEVLPDGGLRGTGSTGYLVEGDVPDDIETTTTPESDIPVTFTAPGRPTEQRTGHLTPGAPDELRLIVYSGPTRMAAGGKVRRPTTGFSWPCID
jgi:hypothetical protein